MKKIFKKIKKFFNNKKIKKILIILVILLVVALICKLYFFKSSPKVIYYTLQEESYLNTDFPETTRSPTPTITPQNFTITENSNEYIVSNIESAFYDDSGNIFFQQDNEIGKYSLDRQETQILNFPKDINLYLYDQKIIGIIEANSDSNDLSVCGYLKDNNNWQDTGSYFYLYEVKNGNLELVDKVDCKYSVFYGGMEYLLTSNEGKNIIQSRGGDAGCGWGKIYKKNGNEYEILLDTSSGSLLEKGDIGYVGILPKKNSLILTEFSNYQLDEDNKDQMGPDFIFKRIFLKDVDSLMETTIINFDQNTSIGHLSIFKINDENYLFYVVDGHKALIINLNNNEKIYEYDFGVDTQSLFFKRNIIDKILIKTMKAGDFISDDTVDVYYCLNLSTKEFVPLDACGDTKKIYLGNWKGKNIYQTNN